MNGSDYEAAARLMEPNAAKLVKNADVIPFWIGDSGDFWYARDEGDGKAYTRFSAASGKRTPLFDHDAMAKALNAALKSDVSKPSALGLARLRLEGDTLHAEAQGKAVAIDLATLQVAVSDLPEAHVLIDPTGRHGAFVRDHNLHLRDIATGKDTALTHDGARHYAYASLPDSSLMEIPRQKTGRRFLPVNTAFSPDGRYLIAPRLDERALGVLPFVEHNPDDGTRRAKAYMVKSAVVGDEDQLRAAWFVFDIEQKTRRRIALPDGLNADGMGNVIPGWDMTAPCAYFLARTVGSKTVKLLAIDLKTGAIRTAIEESSDIRVETNTVEYNRPNIRVLGREAVWYSARSGSGHLYLYDLAGGAVKNAITSGKGWALDIVAVDPDTREIFMTMGGTEDGRDPYQRQLFRGSLDGGALTCLTPEQGDHDFPPVSSPMFATLFGLGVPPPRVLPKAKLFVDNCSTVDTPPVTLLRSTADGRAVAEIERADASALFDAGWKAPTRERVTSADGKTAIWCTRYAPRGVAKGQKRPVIDAVYGGPQVIVAPKNFKEAYGAGNPPGKSALAHMGFAVVVTDGRGTPARDNLFRDAGYNRFTEVAIDDHVAAIEELAKRHDDMDTARVGIYGWSWGGTFTAQAMLHRPDFYSVGITGAGVYDYAALYIGFEGFVGPAAYANGGRIRPEPTAYPENWRPLDITAMADRLTTGKMLIVAAELDENVPFTQAVRLIAALTRARKPYDLLYIPGATHAAAASPYVIQRMWDYFVEHLMDEKPPHDVAIEVAPRVRT